MSEGCIPKSIASATGRCCDVSVGIRDYMESDYMESKGLLGARDYMERDIKRDRDHECCCCCSALLCSWWDRATVLNRRITTNNTQSKSHVAHGKIRGSLPLSLEITSQASRLQQRLPHCS